jgi:tape measure domain-containing protein
MVESTYEIEIKASLDKINSQLSGLENKLGKADKKASSFAKGLTKALAPAAIAAGALAVGLNATIKQAARFEAIGAQFEVLTGNAQSARVALEELKEFSAGTPFQFEDIANAGKKLLGFGFEAEELADRLREIGDVSAAVGAPLGDVALVFGQVRAAGKLTGERLLQFQERAIPIGPAIAKTMGIAETSVKDFVSQGKVSFEDFQKAFASISEEGGLAFGGLEKASRTLEGKISTLGDNFTLLSGAIGDRFLPTSKDAIDALTGMTKGLTSFIKVTEDEKVGKLIDEVGDLETELTSLQKTISQGKGALVTEGFLGISVSNVEEQKKRASEIVELLKEKNRELDSFIGETVATRAKTAEDAESASNERVLNAKTAFNEELKRIDDEINLIKDEEDATREEILTNKLERERLLEQKNKAIKLQEEKKFIKAVSTLNKTNDAAELARRQAQRSQELADQNAFFSAATSLASSSNKVLAAIGKAAALTQIAIKTPEAVASSFAYGASFGGPPVGFALGAIAATAMAAQAAKVIGLADGGMVGGFPRSPGNTDTVPAMLQTGELVVPRSNFNEVVNAVANQRNGGDSETQPQIQEVMISIADSAIEFIEAKLIERNALGIN